MNLTRRDFTLGVAAGACGLVGGCMALNPAPLYDAGADHTLPLPKELEEAGRQVKVRLPGSETVVLVWKGPKDEYSGVSITCTHRGSEVHLNPKENTLDCPSHGSRFGLDGTVREGPAKKPLRAYPVRLVGDRLKIDV